MSDCCKTKKRKKKYNNWIYSLVLLILVLLVSWYKQYQNKNYLQEIQGDTMGGIPYHIKYISPFEEKLIKKNQIDSILLQFNNELSHYIPTSLVSQLNTSKTLDHSNFYIHKTLKKSKLIHNRSSKYFNPSIGPLIDFWGFGSKNHQVKDPKSVPQNTIDSLLYLCDFNKVNITEDTIKKDCTFVSLNFSAIAKGQAVDVIFENIKKAGFENVYVNIGGESKASGHNEKGQTWIIGISQPTDKNLLDTAIARIKLDNQAIATSGNYRNYKTLQNGQKTGHTINPITGYPAKNNLISVSVVSTDCIEADAWATAFMAMGLEYSKRILEKETQLAVYFLYMRNGNLKSYSNASFDHLLIDELIK